MSKTHTLTSTTTGKVYEVRKLRTSDSFHLSVYHYRRAGDTEWAALNADTLKQVRELLHAN